MNAALKADLQKTYLVPTSELGREYGPGTIVARWGNMVAVDFSGHLAHLTVALHTFMEVAA